MMSDKRINGGTFFYTTFARMKRSRIIKKIFLLIFLFAHGVDVFAQENGDADNEQIADKKNKKGFHFGFIVGSLFANQYTANAYDGFGFDMNGKKFSFESSLMNQKINNEYGHGYGQSTDQIALALKVDPNDWSFGENDMPINMHYLPAFMVGMNSRYSVDKRNAILLNVNASKLVINGAFTIYTNPPSGSTQINNGLKTFPIVGGEQRLMFQFGYQRILGNDEKFNFFVEGGLHGTLAKYDKNYIVINSLQIDLLTYYNQNGYSSPNITFKPLGFGLGVFSGFGINLTTSPKWTIQILYSPSYEKINIGEEPMLKFQQSAGVRCYYGF